MALQEGESYRYVPGMGHVPEISVPSVLPKLSGVADISFSGQDSMTIAPSALASLPKFSNDAPVRRLATIHVFCMILLGAGCIQSTATRGERWGTAACCSRDTGPRCCTPGPGCQHLRPAPAASNERRCTTTTTTSTSTLHRC